MLLSGLKSCSQFDPTQIMNQLSEIQMLQAKKDEETKKLGSHFQTANIEDGKMLFLQTDKGSRIQLILIFNRGPTKMVGAALPCQFSTL
jgi:hypothetical protein